MSFQLRRDLRLDLVLCAAVVIVYLIVQIVLLPGPQPFDPAYYLQQAAHFPHVSANAWTLRIGLMAPLSLLVRVLGPSELTFYALPVAASAALAVAAYLLARSLFNDRVLAVCSALVAVLNEDYLLNSSSLFPDVLAAATFTVGMLLLVLGRTRDDGSPATSDSPDRRSYVLPAVAGLFFGWTYLIREFSPILLPAAVLALWLLRYTWRRVLVVAAAALLPVFVELLYGAIRYGNPFERLHVLTRSGVALGHPKQWAPYFHRVHNVFDAAYVFPRTLLTWRTGWPMLALLVIFAVAAVVLRDRRVWLLAGWLGAFWAAMTILGALRSSGGAPRLGIAYARYWAPAFPALALGGMAGAYLLVRGKNPSARRRGTAQLCVAVLAAAVLVPGLTEYAHCRTKDTWVTEPSTRWYQLRSFLASDHARPFNRMVVGRDDARLVPVYSSGTFGGRVWHGQFVNLGRVPHVIHNSGGTLVLIDRRQGRAGQWVPPASPDPWTPVFVSSDGVLTLLAESPRWPADAAAQNRWIAPAEPRHIDNDTCGISPYTTH